jgi:hypothetical protein
VLSENSLTFDLQSYPATVKHIPLIAAKFPQVSADENKAKAHRWKIPSSEYQKNIKQMLIAGKVPQVSIRRK